MTRPLGHTVHRYHDITISNVPESSELCPSQVMTVLVIVHFLCTLLVCNLGAYVFGSLFVWESICLGAYSFGSLSA